METIYSKVIWDELQLKDFKIHLEERDKVENLILDWVKNTEFEKVEEVLEELSWIKKVSFETYYDGPFYGLTQHEDHYFEGKEGYQCDIMIHDAGLFTTMLDICIKTRVSPSELRFMADILEAFQKRIPKPEKGSIDSHHNWGYKTVSGKKSTK